MKSKLAAKACEGMLLITLNVLIMMIPATIFFSMFCSLYHHYHNFQCDQQQALATNFDFTGILVEMHVHYTTKFCKLSNTQTHTYIHTYIYIHMILYLHAIVCNNPIPYDYYPC